MKKYSNSIIIVSILLLLMTFNGCKKSYIPKPQGYFRISFPEKSYSRIYVNELFSFEMASYAQISHDTTNQSEPNWYNIEIPSNRASIHLSYKKVNHNLGQLSEESRELAYKHTIKASAINEQIIIDESKKVYGTLFEIKGNAASPWQFHLTDSTNHFLRGSIYIKEIPNYDSLQPVIVFIGKDLHHLIETFNWE